MTTELPPPGESGPEDHADISRRFLEHAETEIDRGNRLQASEKVWGAVSHALKAVAEKRGWDHGHHQNILDISDHLGREFDRADDFDLLLSSAKDMHTNFYENERGEDNIRRAIRFAGEFVDQLEQVRDAPPRHFTIETLEDQGRLRRLLDISRSEARGRLSIGSSDPHGFSQNPDDGHGNGGSPAVRPSAPQGPPPAGPAQQPGGTGRPPAASGGSGGQRRTRSRTPALSKPKPRMPAGGQGAERPKPTIPGFFKPPKLPGKRR